MISRDWTCLSCHKPFHSYERGNPECPSCGSVRVNWVPGGGHIGKAAPQADRILKSLAADYGLTNLNSPSPSRLNRAMPAVKPPSPAGSLGVKHWAPGFSSEVFNGSHCAPSLNPPDLKGFQPVGRRFPQGTDMVHRGTFAQGRHRPS